MKDDKPTEIKVETTTDAEDSVSQPIVPTKSKKLLWIGLSVVVVLVVAAVTYYLTLGRPSTSQTSSDPLASATKFASPQVLVDEAKPGLKGTVLQVDEATGVGAVNADGYGVYSPPTYQVPGKKFFSLPEENSGSGYIGDSVAAETNYKALVSFFEKNKFQRGKSTANNSGAISTDKTSSYLSYAEYESSNILCAIRHVDASGSELKAHVSSIGCADKASYKASANAAQPFYDIYAKTQTDVSDGLVFSAPVVTDGADGYQRASVYQEDASQFSEDEEVKSFYGLYHRASKEGTWTFFTGVLTDEVPNCVEFNTDTLRKAFKDIECYDTATQKDSSVQ